MSAPAPTTVSRAVLAPLTAVQQRMFIADGADCFRLPFLYPLPDELPTAQVGARVRSALAAAPTLTARYRFDPATRSFEQLYDPSLALLEVPDVGPVADLATHVADRAHQPQLRTGAPVTARTLTHAGRRHLAVEFSHIAIDGIGAASFERLLFGGPPQAAAAPAEAFAAYRRVAQVEARHPIVRPVAALPPLSATGTADRAVRRQARWLPTAWVRQAARRVHVFPRIAVQAAAEAALAAVLPGCGYAAAATWRWQLGLRTTIGNFPALLTHEPPPDDDLAARAADLFREHAEPTIEPGRELADTAAVVFSWEEFGYRHGRYVPVDSVARFGLYLRAVVHPDRVELTADTDPGLVEASTAACVLDRMVVALRPAGSPADPLPHPGGPVAAISAPASKEHR